MSEQNTPGYGAGADMLDRVRKMLQFTPQALALGIDLTRLEPGRCWGRVPYRTEFIGNPDTGVIAGGVLTTFLDQIAGAAVMAAMPEPAIIATIDLRIDYMRPAKPGLDVLAKAHCYKIGRNVAFVRAIAYEESADDPIANAAGAFMLNSDGGRKPGANLKEPRS